MTIHPGLRFDFITPYDQYRDRHGQAATVIEEKDHNSFDYNECGPLWIVQFDDGTILEAWPEEIDPTLMERPK